MSKENQKILDELAGIKDLYSNITSRLEITDLLNLLSTNSFFKVQTKEFLLKKIKSELTEKLSLANNQRIEEIFKKAGALTERFFNLDHIRNKQFKTKVASILLFDITEQGFEKLFERVWTYCLEKDIFSLNDLQNLKNKHTDGNLLNSAVKSGNSKMVAKAVEKKIPISSETINSGKISIQVAKYINKVASTATSSIMNGSMFNLITSKTNSSLLIAAKLKYWDCVKEILKGECTNNLYDREASSNNTLLHYLCEAGQTEIISQLMSIDKEAVKEQLNSINFNQKKPLDLARKNNHQVCIDLLTKDNQFTFSR